MLETYVFAAIALTAVGAVIGVLLMMSIGIKRDDHPGGFPAHTADRTVCAARRMTGAAARRPELADEARQDVLPAALAHPGRCLPGRGAQRGT